MLFFIFLLSVVSAAPLGNNSVTNTPKPYTIASNVTTTFSVSLPNKTNFWQDGESKSLVTTTPSSDKADIKVQTTRYNESSLNNSMICFNETSNSTNTNKTYVCINKAEKVKTKHPYHLYFLISIGAISAAAFPINFLVIVYLLCKKKFRVIELFGVNLSIANLILASFGIAMATYLSQDYFNWSNKFCKGLVSLKLFSLGVNIWTLILLTYYYACTGNGPNVERDAIFKGIVYILEGLMLSGVFAIMAWIKLDKWHFLCVIIEPHSTVEWLLSGIEGFYYCILALLILRYPYHCFKKCQNPKDYPANIKDAPIFIIVFISCGIWMSGMVITLPRFHLFSFEMAAVARMCILMLPTLIQPLLYLLRNTWICIGRNPCSDKPDKYKTDTEAQLICECSGREMCSICDPEYEPEMTYDEKTLLNTEFENNDQIEKTKDIIKKSKKRKNKFSFPKAICRSPNVKKKIDKHENGENQTEFSITIEDEEKKLLKDKLYLNLDPKAPIADYEDSPNVANANKTSEFPSFINPNDATEKDKLKKLNEENNFNKIKKIDEEGRISRGPTFYPFVENKVKKRRKSSSDVKRQPIEEEKSNPSTPIKTESIEKDIKQNEITLPDPIDKKTLKKEKKKKRKLSKKERNEKRDADKDKRASIVSLEWDHYSDSSNSSLSSKSKDSCKKKKSNETENKRDQLSKNSSIDAGSEDSTNTKGEFKKMNLRDLKSAQSCDWEPYSVDESCSSRTSSAANKSPEYSPPHGKSKSKNEKNDFILEEEN